MSLGEILKIAGMNTLLGMGTVFALLALIICVIWCFRWIPGARRQDGAGAGTGVAAGKTDTGRPAEPQTPETDGPLIAAILAAICASKEAEAARAGVSPEADAADRYVVRAIRRRR